MEFNTMIEILKGLIDYSRDMKKENTDCFECYNLYATDELALFQAIHILKLSTEMLKALFVNFEGQDITAEMVKFLIDCGFTELDFKMLNIDIDIDQLDFDF